MTCGKHQSSRHLLKAATALETRSTGSFSVLPSFSRDLCVRLSSSRIVSVPVPPHRTDSKPHTYLRRWIRISPLVAAMCVDTCSFLPSLSLFPFLRVSLFTLVLLGCLSSSWCTWSWAAYYVHFVCTDARQTFDCLRVMYRSGWQLSFTFWSSTIPRLVSHFSANLILTRWSPNIRESSSLFLFFILLLFYSFVVKFTSRTLQFLHIFVASLKYLEMQPNRYIINSIKK